MVVSSCASLVPGRPRGLRVKKKKLLLFGPTKEGRPSPPHPGMSTWMKKLDGNIPRLYGKTTLILCSGGRFRMLPKKRGRTTNVGRNNLSKIKRDGRVLSIAKNRRTSKLKNIDLLLPRKPEKIGETRNSDNVDPTLRETFGFEKVTGRTNPQSNRSHGMSLGEELITLG